MKVADGQQGGCTLAMLHDAVGEIRNLVYDNYFPGLPAASTPLASAHEHRPDTGLCFVDKGVWSETQGYLEPFSKAWKDCVWTVDADRFVPAQVQEAGIALVGITSPADVVANLTDADAARIETIEISTSAFALPEAAGEGALTVPFVFQVHRLSTNRLLLSVPMADEWWQRDDVVVHESVSDLLVRLHQYLCAARWWDKYQRAGCQVWTAKEIGQLLEVVGSIIAGCKAEGQAAAGVGPRVLAWGEVWGELDGQGVWDGRLPGGSKMKMRYFGAYLRELGWEV